MKVLPIKYPIITSLPAIANMNSILSSYEDKYWPWFIQNHIQVVGWDDPELYLQFYYPLFRKHYPLLNKQVIEKEYLPIQDDEEMIQFLINCINHENYIYTCVDTFYISSYSRYNKYHFPHDLLIYGYNSHKRAFMIADFFKIKYEFSEATFEEIMQALNSPNSKSIHFEGIQLLKYNPDEKFTYNIDYIILMLNDYINAYKTSERYRLVQEPGKDSDSWGISVYSLIIKHLSKELKADIRSLHFISDHKIAMNHVVNYLCNTYQISNALELKEEYNQIKNEGLIIRNLGLKYNLNKSDTTLYSLFEKIKNIEKIELQLIHSLISNIT